MVPYVIIRFVDAIFNIIELAIVIGCVFSWFSQGRSNQFIELINKFTYPILEPFRKIQDRFIHGLSVDFSPILALVVIDIIRKFLIRILL